MADLTIEVTYLCGHTKQISGDRCIEVLQEMPFQPDPNRLKFVSTKFCGPECRNSAGDQQPALTPHPNTALTPHPNTAPSTGNAGAITNPYLLTLSTLAQPCRGHCKEGHLNDLFAIGDGTRTQPTA